MITENLSTLKIHKLTQAQYDRELAAGNIDENALYLTPDEEIDLSPYATVEQLNSVNDSLTDVVYAEEDSIESATTPLNADTLGGRLPSEFALAENLTFTADSLQSQIDNKAPAGDYATKSFVTNKIAEAQLGGGGSGEIDLTGYATKDDIADVANNVQGQINNNYSIASNAQASANTAQGRADAAYQVASNAQASANTAQYTADNALAKAGGDMTGYVNFNDTSTGLSWRTADGTIMNLRPYSPANVFQLTLQNPSKGVAEYGVINIGSDGKIEFNDPAQVRTNISALSTSGGTITGVVKHTANHYVHQATNNQSSDAYCKIATIKIIGNYINQEIYFKIAQRGNRIANVYIQYYNSGGTNPSLQNFETDNQNFWLVPEDTSVWGLYAYCSSWDSVDVIDFSTGAYNAGKMNITWANVSASSLPSGAFCTTSRAIHGRYYGASLPSSAPEGAIFFKKVT